MVLNLSKILLHLIALTQNMLIQKFNLFVGKTYYMHYQESMKEQTPILKMIKMINIFHPSLFSHLFAKMWQFSQIHNFFVIQSEEDKIILNKQELMHMNQGKKNKFLCSFVRISYCFHCKYSHHLKNILLSKMHDNIQHVEKVDSKNLTLPHKKIPTTNNKS